jgi:NADPH:quinone reductase
MTIFPRVPGRDFAGHVIEGPDELIGTRVWGAGGRELGFTRDGSHAQVLAVPSDAAVPLPGLLSFDDAAASASAYFTAHEAIARAGVIGEGCAVLVTGAVGAVGTAAFSLARQQGARVIGAVRGPAEVKLAETFGFVAVADTERDDLAAVVRAVTSGRGADIAVDTVGGLLLAPVLHSLATAGGACVISSAPAIPIGFDILEFYRADLRLAGLNTGRLDCRRAGEILRSLAPGFESGSLRVPRIVSRYRLTDAAAAYQEVKAGAVGRVLLLPQA